MIQHSIFYVGSSVNVIQNCFTYSLIIKFQFMKKYLLLSVTLLLLGAGCAKQPASTNTILEGNTNNQLKISVQENLNSPLSALLDQVAVGKSGIDYPRVTNIRIVSDAEAGFNPSSFTVTYIEEGLGDDAIRKQEYQMKLRKQENENWKVTDKKLVKQD